MVPLGVKRDNPIKKSEGEKRGRFRDIFVLSTFVSQHKSDIR